MLWTRRMVIRMLWTLRMRNSGSLGFSAGPAVIRGVRGLETTSSDFSSLIWLLTDLCWNLYPAASAQFLLNEAKRLYAEKKGPSESTKGFGRSKGSLRPRVKFSIYKEGTPSVGRSGGTSPPPPREICILHQVLKGCCETPEKDLSKGFVWRGDYPISGLGYLTNALGEKKIKLDSHLTPPTKI